MKIDAAARQSIAPSSIPRLLGRVNRRSRTPIARINVFARPAHPIDGHRYHFALVAPRRIGVQALLRSDDITELPAAENRQVLIEGFFDGVGSLRMASIGLPHVPRPSRITNHETFGESEEPD
jgi:hypothetical protein